MSITRCAGNGSFHKHLTAYRLPQSTAAVIVLETVETVLHTGGQLEMGETHNCSSS